ncbi:hypothetical protein ACFL3V_03520 [Nanoarchaeota archaeon]
MNQIEHVQDAKAELSDCLKASMEDRSIFDPITHQYLSDVIGKYVKWQEGSLIPSIHTRDTEPFVFQLNKVNTKYAFEPNRRYKRMKKIGETLLFAVGYWTESISSVRAGDKVIKARPNLLYYAKNGMSAYHSVSIAAHVDKTLTEDVEALMEEMAQRFTRYASAIHGLRQDLGGNRLDDITILLELTKLIGDDALKAFTLEQQLLYNGAGQTKN